MLFTKSYNFSEVKTNLLSGLTVALAMVPEAIAFALIAHVSPLTGLYAAIIICLTTSAFGGRPGMISGATGALAVVMVALVVQHGVEYLFATVVLMGILQLIFAIFRLGKYIRMVPYSVMLGFVNGLAIVIFIAQFGHFKVMSPEGISVWMSGMPLFIMMTLTAVTVLIIYIFPLATKAIPSTLASILIVSIVVIFPSIMTQYSFNNYFVCFGKKTPMKNILRFLRVFKRLALKSNRKYYQWIMAFYSRKHCSNICLG